MHAMPLAQGIMPTSREAILDAAAHEFSIHGLTGTRMERVAKQAGINKALVYRYFGDKQALFRAALRRLFEKRREILETLPAEIDDAIVHWFRKSYDDRDFLRLIQREALNDDGDELVEEPFRRDYYKQQIASLKALQESGRLSRDFETRFLFLGLLALIAYPVMFPTVSRLVTGLDVESRTFRRGWSAMLKQLTRSIVSPSQ